MVDRIFLCIQSVIIIVGLISNNLGLVTFALSKKLKNIGVRKVHIFLFIADSIFLIITIVDRVSFYNGYDLITFSSLSCKLYPYVNRIFATLSPMILVFIFILFVLSDYFTKFNHLSLTFSFFDPYFSYRKRIKLDLKIIFS